MPKLTERERMGFERILTKDLKAINAKFLTQIKEFWVLSRKEVMKIKGWDKLEQEKEKLFEQKNKLSFRINDIENTINSEELTPEQIAELGGESNDFGRYRGAEFYGIPSQFEYEVYQYIKERVNMEIPSKIIMDVCESSIRELVMAGTFEEARGAYEKFYSLNFRQYGVDIPPRLDDITKDNKLLHFAQNTMNLIENKGEGNEKIKRLTGTKRKGKQKK